MQLPITTLVLVLVVLCLKKHPSSIIFLPPCCRYFALGLLYHCNGQDPAALQVNSHVWNYTNAIGRNSLHTPPPPDVDSGCRQGTAGLDETRSLWVYCRFSQLHCRCGPCVEVCNLGPTQESHCRSTSFSCLQMLLSVHCEMTTSHSQRKLLFLQRSSIR